MILFDSYEFFDEKYDARQNEKNRRVKTVPLRTVRLFTDNIPSLIFRSSAIKFLLALPYAPYVKIRKNIEEKDVVLLCQNTKLKNSL